MRRRNRAARPGGPGRVKRVYGFSVERQITQHGDAAIEHSARRYIELLAEEHRGG